MFCSKSTFCWLFGAPQMHACKCCRYSVIGGRGKILVFSVCGEGFLVWQQYLFSFFKGVCLLRPREWNAQAPHDTYRGPKTWKSIPYTQSKFWKMYVFSGHFISIQLRPNCEIGRRVGQEAFELEGLNEKTHDTSGDLFLTLQSKFKIS